MHSKPHTDEIQGKIYDWNLIKRLMHYLKPYLMLFIVSLMLLILISALELVGPYLVKIGIDTYIKNSNYTGLNNICLLFLLVLLIKFFGYFLQNYYTQLMGQKIIRDIRMDLFTHAQSLSLAFFDRYPVGRLMTRICNDVEVLNEMLSFGIIKLIGDISTLMGVVVVMLIMNVKLALVSFTILPFIIWVSITFRHKVRGAFREIREKIAQLNSFMQENISGIKEVQLFGRENHNFKRFDLINGKHRDAYLRAILYYSFFFPAIEILASISTALIIWYGGLQAFKGALTIGVLVAFIQYMGKFFRPLRELGEKYNLLQSTMASAERIYALLDTKQKSNAIPSPKPFPGLKKEIVFENVWFAYEDKNWILKDISFHITKGETIAIVGATGAGKTTIINVLGQYYNIQKGRILIDGIDIREYDPKEIRRAMPVVQQDVFLFSNSIKENIALGNPNLDIETIHKITRYIKADTFIEKFPEKYEQILTERGNALSVGQKQLLAFARALAADPSILILDEATSSVDIETEGLIQDALLKLVLNRTSIIIAHRLSTITNADKIIVLHKGKVAEQGTHKSLLKEGVIYKKLYEMLNI